MPKSKLYRLIPENEESPPFKAIREALVTYIGGFRDLTLDDLVLVHQIEANLISQGLLRPEGCICRAREDELE